MPTNVVDHSRQCALIVIRRGRAADGLGIPEVGRQDAILLENHGALGAGDLHASRISRVGGSRRLDNAQGAAGKLKNSDRGVFRFNGVQRGCRPRLHSNYIAQQPQQQIQGMHGLIDQCAATIQRDGSPPARAAVVVRRSIPFHFGIGLERSAQDSSPDPLTQFANARFHAVLKHDAKFYPSAVRCFDEFVRAPGADIDWFLGQHMQTAPRGRDTLGSMQPGWASNRNQVHRPMRQESLKVQVRRPAMLTAKTVNLAGVGPVDGGDFNSGNRTSGAGVSAG